MATRRLAAAVALALMAIATAAKADPQSLSTNVPVEVEDALAVPKGKFQLQFDQRYTRDPNATSSNDLGTPELVLKLGAAKGLQLDFSPSYNWGSSKSRDGGLMTVDALYNFNHDSKWVPALAVHAYAQYGYGANAPSDQYVVRALATKYLGDGSDSAPRLHFNLTWTHVMSPAATDRDDQYSVGAAYSQLVTKSDAVVVDFVHANKAVRHMDQDLIDIGVIHQFSDSWSIAAGGGAGISGDSPERRLFFALQRTFDWF